MGPTDLSRWLLAPRPGPQGQPSRAHRWDNSLRRQRAPGRQGRLNVQPDWNIPPVRTSPRAESGRLNKKSRDGDGSLSRAPPTPTARPRRQACSAPPGTPRPLQAPPRNRTGRPFHGNLLPPEEADLVLPTYLTRENKKVAPWASPLPGRSRGGPGGGAGQGRAPPGCRPPWGSQGLQALRATAGRRRQGV